MINKYKAEIEKYKTQLIILNTKIDDQINKTKEQLEAKDKELEKRLELQKNLYLKSLGERTKELSATIEKQNKLILQLTNSKTIDLEKYYDLFNITAPPQNPLAQSSQKLEMMKLLADSVKAATKEFLDGEKTSKMFPPLVADLKLIPEGLEIYQMWLSNSKSKRERAYKIQDLKAEKKKLIQENVILHQQINEFFALFPHAKEILTFDGLSDPEIPEEADPTMHFLTSEEYYSLSSIERDQLALDRYKNRGTKTNWEIGRDFELYVGHIAESRGFVVEYFGTMMKLQDLGRDLILKKGNQIIIVQCKFWGKDKEIHEKHIAQLYGTTAMYMMENRKKPSEVSSLFICHNSLSDEAKKFADYLGVKYIENLELGEYPMIKCNVSSTGEKIYHLPFDQKYDDTIIGNREGEFMAYTVKEAVSNGFRRAMKHFGPYT